MFLASDSAAVRDLRGAWGEDLTRDALARARRRKLVWGAVHSIQLEKTDLDHAGMMLLANDERGLRSGRDMARVFADLPDAVHATGELMMRLGFTLKDAGAQIRAVLFRNRLPRVRFEPKDGLHVIAGGSLEVDIYGGIKGTFAKSDLGYDVGLLYYWYPGDVTPGSHKADTFELYGALTWKWLSGKLSYSLQDKTFGVADSQGTYYLDLSAAYPLPNTKFTLIGHYGMQKFEGNNGAVGCISTSNDACASYNDWKIGVNYSLPKDFTAGVFYTDTTSMDPAAKLFYTSASGKKIGDGTVTAFVQKTF